MPLGVGESIAGIGGIISVMTTADRLSFRIVHLSKRTWYDTLGQIFPLGCHLLNIPYSLGGLVHEFTIDR